MTKQNNRYKYVFTVEGDTEKWYFDWLEAQINKCDTIEAAVSIEAIVEQSPMKYAKRINNLSTPEIFHICDVESKEQEHVNKLKRILGEMKKAKKDKGIRYNFGYSNYTFELWMVLHKKACYSHLANRTQYLSHINRAFGEQFEDLDKYKSYDAFHRCLKKITLIEVKNAIDRAKLIMNTNRENEVKEINLYGYRYFDENPSLTIWEAVERILIDCGYIPKH